MEENNKRALRKENPARAVLESRGWYHSFRFQDGTEFEGVLPVEISQARYSQFPIPENLEGKTLLDIGAWDGWFSFEAERHGAMVTAIDAVEMSSFWIVHKKLNSQVIYRELDLFEIPGADLGNFDYVLFLGVLYHTKHPLLALEIVCSLTREIAVIESYVIDSQSWMDHQQDIPSLEFYETDELGGQMDNWFGPTVGCLIALCRAAGFARVEVLSVVDNRAALGCYRRWEKTSSGGSLAKTVLAKVANAIRGGINFRSSRDEYLSWWFEPKLDSEIERDQICFEVDGLAARATYVGKTPSGWVATSRMPPGVQAGWHNARMRLKGCDWSDTVRFAVDINPQAAPDLAIAILCDGSSWEANKVDLSRQPPHISAWISGLSENADEINVKLEVGETSLRVLYVSAETNLGERQVNCEWPTDLSIGVHSVVVRHAGIVSKPVPLLADGQRTYWSNTGTTV